MTFINNLLTFKFNFSDSCGKGASKVQILDCEKTLKIELPLVVNQYLSTIGFLAGKKYAMETFGLGDDVPEHLNLTKQTLWERNEAFPSMPIYLLPFENDGSGCSFCVVLSDDVLDDPIMLLWDIDLAEAVEFEDDMTFTKWIEVKMQL